MRAWGTVLVGVCLVASILPLASPVHAQGAFVLVNGRNHPELTWMELKTEHFRIFYHDPCEPWAREAATILERFHAPLCQRLDVERTMPTRVYLSDQDQIANGAAVGWDYFFAWVPSHATFRSFAGGRSWFEEVLIHEYAHVLVSDASRTWIGNFAFTLGFYPPRWVQEGIAQWVAEAWSVLRGDATVAAAILDGSIDRNPPGVPGRSRLVDYARGHARIRWLAATYGDSAIAKMIRPHASLDLYTFSSSNRVAFGKEASEWPRRFGREMIAFYGERFRRGEPPDSLGRTMETGIAYPTAIVQPSDSLRFLVGQQKRGAGESSLFQKLGSRPPERLVASGILGRPTRLKDGRLLVTRMHRASHGSWVEDLAIYDPLLGSCEFITSGERVAEPGLLAGKRIVALADSPTGPSLVQAPLPSAARRATFTRIGSWERGWVVHSLASSPDGSRVLFSATEPDGRRGLWGADVGRVQADTTRLSRDSFEARDAAWIDREQFAWTSHAGGIAQIQTGRWRWGERLSEVTARTGLGTGVALIGVDSDSLLVLDRTSRITQPIRRLDPKREPVRTVADSVYPFRMAASVEPQGVVPRIEGPFRYRAIDEIRPWMRLPLVGPQAGEPAIGFAGAWAEPLLHHAFAGYIYGSAEQATHPDRGAFYLTTRFGPYIVVFHSSSNSARRFLRDSFLIERREVTGAALLAPLHSSVDPLVSGWIDGFIETDSRRPRSGGRDLSTPAGRPRAWSALRLGGGSGLIRVPAHGMSAVGPTEGCGVSLRLNGGVATTGAARRFLRATLHLFDAVPLPLIVPASLWVEARFEGASDGLPPQEFIGLDADASHRLLSGWPGIDGTIYLRGWPRARAARNVVATNVEVRFRVLPDLGVRGPGIGIHGGTLAPFLEAAHPWGGRSASLFQERTRIAIGIEGRFAARIGPFPLVPAVAWGHPLGESGPDGSWSVRLTTALPFSMPMNPRALLRAALGHALQDDAWGAFPRPTD